MYPTRHVDIEVEMIGALQGTKHVEPITGSDPRAIARQAKSWFEMTLEDGDMPDAPTCDRVLVTTDDPMFSVWDGVVLDLEVGEDTDPHDLEKKILRAGDANAGVECAECGQVIGYRQGCSSPVGSLHKECAQKHESANPSLW
jgi:hypothetical protein